MDQALHDVCVGVLERRHPPGHRGALIDQLVPLLREYGAQVDVVHAELGPHRLDRKPPWDVVVLKSGMAAALHLAAAAEGWSIPCINMTDATRLAQNKLASMAILQRANIPTSPSYLAWLDTTPETARKIVSFDMWADRRVLVKAARGAQGVGLWSAESGELPDLITQLRPGPYLITEYLPHEGDDLKIFVVGEWITAIERPFPAKTYEEKLGRPVPVPHEVADVAHAAGRLLGLTCYGCDFIRTSGGWRLIDVNAFPGYKGAREAPLAIAVEIARVVHGGTP